MKRKNLLRIVLTTILCVSLLISSVAFSQTNSTALIKAAAAYMQSQGATAADEEIRIDIRFSAGKNATKEDKQLENLLKKMYIKARVISDVYKYETYTNLSIFYSNAKLIDGAVYVNKDIVVYNFPQIYSKPLYLKLNQANTNIYTQIDVEKYRKLFDPNSNQKLQNIITTYSPILLPKISKCLKLSDKKTEVVLSNGKKVQCDEVIFELNKNSSLDILKTFLSKAATDKNTKAYIIEVLKVFLEDINKLSKSQPLPEAEGVDVVSTLNVDEVIQSVETNYEEAVSQSVYALDELKDQIPPFTFQYRLMVDDKNNLKGERIYFYLKDSNDLKFMLDIKGSINYLGKNINVPKIDVSKGVDIMKLTEKDNQQIQQNAEKLIKDISKKLGIPLENLKL